MDLIVLLRKLFKCRGLSLFNRSFLVRIVAFS